jgi:hypothetical protein
MTVRYKGASPALQEVILSPFKKSLPPRAVSAAAAALFLIQLLLPSARALEHSEHPRLYRFKISSYGLNVGELHTAVSSQTYKGMPAQLFASDLLLDVNLLLVRKKSQVREETVLGAQGPLSYRKWGEDDGRKSAIEGDFEGGDYIFQAVEEGVAHGGVIRRESFDATSSEWPETTLKREGETKEVRFLDLARASVVTRRYRYLRNEVVEVAGRSFNCKVVELCDPNFRCTRWVSGTGSKMLLVRQDGKAHGSNYTVRLVEAG